MSPGGDVAEADKETLDRTFTLPSGKGHTLWIPANYLHRDDQVDLIVNFHGSPRVARESVQAAGLNCVVLSVNYAGLSSVYRKPFAADRERFENLLTESLEAIRAQPDFPPQTQWGSLAITSFSAGFGAVREILKTQSYFDEIDGVFMIDSLYCGYVGDGSSDVQTGVVHPGLMKDFLRFAEASAQGKKVMIITHCNGPTPGYASTRETADYLLEKLGLEPQPIETIVRTPQETQSNTGGLKLYRHAARNGFSLYGSPGGNETDHGEHLRHMAHWLPKLPLAKREPGPATP